LPAAVLGLNLKIPEIRTLLAHSKVQSVREPRPWQAHQIDSRVFPCELETLPAKTKEPRKPRP
jgi:hypothetical protein